MRRTWKAKYTRSSKNRWLHHTLQFIFDTILRSTLPGKDCTRHFVVSVLHHCVICHLSYKSYKQLVSWFDPIYPSQHQNLLPTLEIITHNFQNFQKIKHFGKKFQNLEFFSKISKTTKGPPMTSKGPPPPY